MFLKYKSPNCFWAQSLIWKYLEIYVLRNLSWLQIWGCCKELWIEWKLGSGLFPEQIWEEAKESKKKQKDQLQERIALSFLPWLVGCTKVTLVALSKNTEILHEILLCWIWPLGPHNNNNFFCKSATTSKYKCRQACKYKIPFYHHPTPLSYQSYFPDNLT